MNRTFAGVEAPDYYYTYINQVPDGDIVGILEAQLGATTEYLERIDEARSLYRYAPDKWSIREALAHVNDTERLFVFRGFWFARGLEAPLPSFDQDVAMRHTPANGRSWASHVGEFRSVRLATVDLFKHLDPDAWQRRGQASGYTFTVRAFAYITAGHLLHHLAVLRDKYGVR